MLGRSLEISSEAQIAGMRAARPDAFEYEVEAAIEAVHRRRGAASRAYPSIVGSGPNATILHYTENTRQMQAGELLLVDAACAYEYMAGDITRTYPVSGKFTALQKDIYAIVLQAQEEAMKVARAGTPLTEVHDKTVEVIKAGLLKLGLITDTTRRPISALVYPRGEPLPRHRRPRRRRTHSSAGAGHGIRDRAGHLHPAERARGAASHHRESGTHRADSAGGDANTPTSASGSKTRSCSKHPGCAAFTASVPRTIEEVEALLARPAASR